MSNTERDTLEELLRHASPRPMPGTDAAEAAKASVRSDWIDEVTRRNRRRKVSMLAVAATVLVGVFVASNGLLVPEQEPVQLAVIQKSFGPVYFLGDDAELRPSDELSVVSSGQALGTGINAGMALAGERGGSLRVDENSRLRFNIDGTVFVDTGRVYFDSMPAVTASIEINDLPELELATPHGVVRHVGTQYMTQVDADSLVVSVREGEVHIDGKTYEQKIGAGQQATLVGRQRPNILRISTAGDAWNWVTKTTPVTDVEGMSLHNFLVWVSRELGLELRFEGRSEAVAQVAILKGTIDVEPAEALRLRLATAALDWRIEDGVIYITD